MGIRVYLAGRLALEVDGAVVIDERQLKGKQGRLVFTYLVCERTRPVSRDGLARLIWPAETPTAWESALSALMSHSRSLLSSNGLATRGVYVWRGSGQYQLSLPTDAWIDLEAGAAALDEAESAVRAGSFGAVLGPATVAASISRRPFLSGIEGEWVESQRGRLERQLLRALDCLSKMWLASAEPGLAIETATQAIDLDRFRESSYRLLMRAHASTGNRAKAVEVYHTMRQVLRDELGTDPSSGTEALYLEMLG